MEFPGVSMKEVACGKSIQGLIKKEVDFSGVIKKVNVEFQGVLVFGLEISKGWNKILRNFQQG